MTTPTLMAAREYAQLLLKQHELDPRGEKESEELNGICEAMSSPWDRMDGPHRRLMKGLSVDLYALADGRRGKLMLAEHQVEWRKQGRVLHAGKDYAAVLEHLRKPYPYGVPTWWILVLQARYWLRLGFPEVAVLFIREARKLAHGAAKIFVLHAFETLGCLDEACEMANSIIDDKKSDRVDIYLAAACLYASMPERRVASERIIGPLKHILAQEKRDFFRNVDFEKCVVRLLGAALGDLDEHGEANEFLTETINEFPDDLSLIIFRAVINSPADPAAAKLGFRAAVDSGAMVVSPYLGLARFTLQEREFNNLLQICDQALRLEKVSDSARSWFFEWRGIALAETGQSRECIEEEFSRAAALAPDRTEQINANRDLALSRLQMVAPNTRWQFPNNIRSLILNEDVATVNSSINFNEIGT